MVSYRRITAAYLSAQSEIPPGFDVLFADPAFKRRKGPLLQSLVGKTPQQARNLLLQDPDIHEIVQQLSVNTQQVSSKTAADQGFLQQISRRTGLALGTLALLSTLAAGASGATPSSQKAPQTIQQAPRDTSVVAAIDSVKSTDAYNQLRSILKLPGALILAVSWASPEVVVGMGIPGFTETMTKSVGLTLAPKEVKQALGKLNTDQERAAALTGVIDGQIKTGKAASNYGKFVSEMGEEETLKAIYGVALRAVSDRGYRAQLEKAKVSK
jgi:hypothetical protein